jgi:hypothetical protein
MGQDPGLKRISGTGHHARPAATRSAGAFPVNFCKELISAGLRFKRLHRPGRPAPGGIGPDELIRRLTAPALRAIASALARGGA